MALGPTREGLPDSQCLCSVLSHRPTSPYCPSPTCPPHPLLELDGASTGVWDAHAASSTVAQREPRSPWKGLLHFCSALPSTLCSHIKLPRVHSLSGEREAQRGEGLHELPITAITTFHEFTALKQHTFILLWVWRPEVQSGSHWIRSYLGSLFINA